MSRLQEEMKLAGNDYQEPKIETVDALTQRIDDLRLSGLANIESLIQLILVNRELSRAVFVNVDEQVEILSNVAKAIRKV